MLQNRWTSTALAALFVTFGSALLGGGGAAAASDSWDGLVQIKPKRMDMVYVLRLSTTVEDLYINAPDTMEGGRVQSYAAEAGEATLILEARDSLTNALLGRVVDQRETR